jgi:exodeoxyribonuclease V alpha subunit
MNRSLLGARNLNQVLQAALNPGDGGPEVQRFGWTFRIGDRVIQTENDYDRDVFNGDLGILVGTKKALGLAVRRQDTSRRYTALRKRLQEA